MAQFIIDDGFLVSAKIKEIGTGEKKFRTGRIVVREVRIDPERNTAKEQTHYISTKPEEIEKISKYLQTHVMCKGEIVKVDRVVEGQTRIYENWFLKELVKK
ncbi:hypothetical protein [Clostridium thermosuccinogenes]|jgi:hypothetical protein|uniref:hypothetical protein n=1 Tax=Clostridium thermosuccinogenes TaxID=84032 RepID=UPI000CCC7D87|nr:hypothetical protein [Pseudoclostridium thermosuccinogenes]PNT90888.1 hypothetical protein CDQ83_13685 [Pseudoclostridium thermosuccinogenes]